MESKRILNAPHGIKYPWVIWNQIFYYDGDGDNQPNFEVLLFEGGTEKHRIWEKIM